MKQRKLLGVLTIALTLVLSACNGGGGGKSGSSRAASHKHEYGDWQVVTAATCTEAGTEKRICKNTDGKCTKVEDTKTTPALGHQEPTDPSARTVVTAATCTEDGSYTFTCERCGQTAQGVETKLGHDLGEWAEVEPATCDKAGSRKRECSRCDYFEEEAIAAKGHDFQPVGAEDPVEGKARVQLFACANGCGKSYLGFKANEVSEASKSHLTFAQPNEKGEIGASFWGRPIGNAIALDSTGTSVAQQVDETVYCSTETGDFFEYIFDLTQDQINQSGLDNCRLYLDAKPADHMNGGDFFAYRGGNTDDWTPGFYIDGADDHIEKNEDGTPIMVKDHARSVRAEDGSEAAGVELETEVPMGKRITDYRYVLYVDDEVQAFEQGVSNPTHGNSTNMTREEFCLPFVFKLHAGENKIRLGMAGGYRSTFYNFTFRPVEEQGGEGGEGGEGGDTVDYTQVLPRNWANGTPANNSDNKEYIPLSDNAAGKVGVKINMMNFTVESDATTGTTLGTDGKIAPGNDHSAIITYKVKAPKAGAYQMVMRGKTSSSGVGKTLNDRYFTVTLNGVAVDVQGTRDVLTETMGDFVAAPTINLTGNEDTIKITAPDYRPVFDVSAETGFIIFSEH